MRVLVINPIMYTSETKHIPKVKSVKDSMIYDLCLSFHKLGHEVVLCAGEPYKPCVEEKYPFEIIWAKCVIPKVFLPHRFPVMTEVRRYIKKNIGYIDLIISGEVFSLNSLFAYRLAPDKLIVWHELAKHNALFKKIPSKVWYNVVTKLFMKNVRVVARSKEARVFISRYCNNVERLTIDHGVNLDKFNASVEKDNKFVVCSQLIPRKRIDGIIQKFAEYLNKYDSTAVLYIIGSGTLDDVLKELVKQLKIESNVIFTGKMNHEEIQPILSRAKALLVNTVKDNNMISIVESIAVGTPIVTTDVPLNSEYIIASKLGIAKPEWDECDLNEISINNPVYVENCMRYREKLSTEHKVKQFIEAFNSK